MWRFRVESHLASLHDRMTEVLEKELITIIKCATRNRPKEKTPDKDGNTDDDEANTTEVIYVVKLQAEYTTHDFKVDNLDRVARNVIQSTISDTYLPRVMKFSSMNEMWEMLALISQVT